jgi:hypothetical protein
VLAGRHTLVLEHLADGGRVRAHLARLSVDQQGDRLLRNRVGQQTADESEELSPPQRIPSADAIARDFQRFLRQRGPEDEG